MDPLHELTHTTTRDGRPLHVRTMRRSDFDQVFELYTCRGVLRGTLQVPWAPEDLRRAWFEKALASATDHSLVAVLDGVVVGSIGLHVTTAARRRHTAGIGMAVHDDVQGIGIGSALLAAVVHLADEWLALRRLELTVYPDNEPAVRLYERHGFEREGVLRDYAFRDGQYIDALSMARLCPRRPG